MDGHIAIICVGEIHWRALVTEMARPDLADDPRFATLAARVAHIDLVDDLVGTWTAAQTKDALFQRLMAAKVPCAPVRTLDEVINDPNMHARGALEWQEHPQLGRIVVQQSPLRYDGVPPRPLVPSRELGADTARVLREVSAKSG